MVAMKKTSMRMTSSKLKKASGGQLKGPKKPISPTRPTKKLASSKLKKATGGRLVEPKRPKEDDTENKIYVRAAKFKKVSGGRTSYMELDPSKRRPKEDDTEKIYVGAAKLKKVVGGGRYVSAKGSPEKKEKLIEQATLKKKVSGGRLVELKKQPQKDPSIIVYASKLKKTTGGLGIDISTKTKVSVPKTGMYGRARKYARKHGKS